MFPYSIIAFRWVTDTLREAKAHVDVLEVAVNQCLDKVKTDQAE
jgi:hypothetical protein